MQLERVRGKGICGYCSELKIYFRDRTFYCINKVTPQLKRTICRINSICKQAYEPYFCVVYSLNDDTDHVNDIEIIQHRNSKTNMEMQRLYIRIEPTVLKHQDTLLRSNEQPQDEKASRKGIKWINSVEIHVTRTKEYKSDLQPQNCPQREFTSSWYRQPSAYSSRDGKSFVFSSAPGQ